MKQLEGVGNMRNTCHIGHDFYFKNNLVLGTVLFKLLVINKLLFKEKTGRS